MGGGKFAGAAERVAGGGGVCRAADGGVFLVSLGSKPFLAAGRVGCAGVSSSANGAGVVGGAGAAGCINSSVAMGGIK